MWDKLVKAGVSPELSYYVVSMCSSNNALYTGHGHSVMNTSPSGKGFLWFKTISPDSFQKMPSMATKAESVYGVSELFAYGDPLFKPFKRPFGGSLQNDLIPFCIVKGVGYNRTNTLDPSHKPLITFLKGIDNA